MSASAKKIPQDSQPAGPDWRETLSSERLAHLVKLTYRGLSRALQLRLRKQSVLYGHWTLLRILWQTDGMTQRQLSEQAGVMEPTTFAALQAMEKLGYVSRQKIAGNGKQVRVFLTAKGAALRNLIVPAAEEVNQVALAGIPPEDLAATRRTLLAIMHNLGVDEAAVQAADLPDEAA
ncbi:DNA-binding transcriptional regulator, MarR family [Noviherbaspirillum humi]|uniref:DNA-binding transcriptional regulator, MarR family n=1 Tax=Noviherbaspirillum humi TaxID=1688639 RepID=A0A239I0D2_9BURK|nr:MarR family transcriptional regulator [Noviherbaspirillum humi]SNS86483.1 DNA-binding transcriptional regulator, MarR family [Noviherbaspirillum humi]